MKCKVHVKFDKSTIKSQEQALEAAIKITKALIDTGAVVVPIYDEV